MDAAQVVADTSTPGQIVLGASRVGDRPGVAGRGVVARLHFRTLAPGPAVVSITAVRAMDKSLDEIASEVRAEARIEISQPGTAFVPRFLEEPATAP